MNDPLAEAETTNDLLVGDWFIHQLRRGHRFNTDDLLLAWLARRERPDAETVLDLGCGVGSVGLLTLAGLSPDARLVGVEAQAVSAALYRRTLAQNGLEARVTAREGDLRDPATGEAQGRFDLVLANPPYLPESAALRSPNPQRAAAPPCQRGASRSSLSGQPRRGCCSGQCRGGGLPYAQPLFKHHAPSNHHGQRQQKIAQ